MINYGRPTSALDDLEPLWHALAAHHGDVMPWLGPLRERADSWSRRRAYYEERLAQPGAFLLIAELDDAPVGYAMVAPGAPSQTWAIEAGGDARDDRAAARGAREGPRLRAHGPRPRGGPRCGRDMRLGLSVVAANEDAISFYRRHGFEPAFIEMIARP